jgi:hypothetical protein
MASNPIQRRARQSFLIGFLIALIIMAIVVAFLFMKINKLSEEKDAIKLVQTTVYTLLSDVKSGDEITEDMLMPQTLETTLNNSIDTSNYLTPYSFEYETEDGTEIKYYSKIDIPAGSVMVESMVYAEGEQTTNDERTIEYNMLVLPSKLVNGDYIDIRYQLPDGQDYIVLSKKRVEQCTESAIWIDMDELDLNMMNSAIIDSYLTTGSMLYATIYKEPGMQDALTQTYAPSIAVVESMSTNPNILDEAKQTLSTRWNNQGFTSQRDKINSYTSDETTEQKASTVESERQESITDIATMRSDYVSALEGTGLVGESY